MSHTPRIHKHSKHAKQCFKSDQSGITLIETMVAVLIVMVGILGFVKFQANALASTQVSKNRSTVVMMAASLSSAMLANHEFWSSVDAPALVSTSAGNVLDGTGKITNTLPACYMTLQPAGVICSPQKMATYDVKRWATSLSAILPGSTSKITCKVIAQKPNECAITISWNERYVNGGNLSATDSQATGGTRSYTLHVVPRGKI